MTENKAEEVLKNTFRKLDQVVAEQRNRKAEAARSRKEQNRDALADSEAGPDESIRQHANS